MKKVLALLLSTIIFLMPSLTPAQEMNNTTEGNQTGMMGGDGKMGGRGWRMAKMGGMMGARTMVASEDGGVIILAGNKLMKYDKDLNLVKEVEIKIEGCPMMDKDQPQGPPAQQ